MCLLYYFVSSDESLNVCSNGFTLFKLKKRNKLVSLNSLNLAFKSQ